MYNLVTKEQSDIVHRLALKYRREAQSSLQDLEDAD